MENKKVKEALRYLSVAEGVSASLLEVLNSQADIDILALVKEYVSGINKSINLATQILAEDTVYKVNRDKLDIADQKFFGKSETIPPRDNKIFLLDLKEKINSLACYITDNVTSVEDDRMLNLDKLADHVFDVLYFEDNIRDQDVTNEYLHERLTRILAAHTYIGNYLRIAINNKRELIDNDILDEKDYAYISSANILYNDINNSIKELDSRLKRK